MLAQLSSRGPDRLEPGVLAALRLGLAQLLLLDGVAAHAAVHESVELAKRDSRGGAGLVNAVLRRATREGPGILADLRDDTPEDAAIMHSVPVWLARMWFAELGADEARALLAASNRPPESALRVNTLVARPVDVIAELPVDSHPAPGIPEGLVLEGPFDAGGSELWREGAIMGQSRGSMTPPRSLAPQPGERVLDLCAAPGAKTGQLAALMAGEGRLVAVERHRGRAQELVRTLARLRAAHAEVICADATTLALDERFDRVLVDPPCSGLGTLQSRPDLRWRATPQRVTELAPIQLGLLRCGARHVDRGGTLVYSVCTISRAESETVVQRFLDAEPDFVPDGDAAVRLMPHRDGTDGFFIAQMTRRGAT